jgi:4'-phosphopantetheinyl transferase EntD
MRSSTTVTTIRYFCSRNSTSAKILTPFRIVRSSTVLGGKCSVIELPTHEFVGAPLGTDANINANAGFTLGEFKAATKYTSKLAFNSFLGGRAALRHSMECIAPGMSQLVPCILPNTYGAPELPPPLKGSVSHKDMFAVGLVMQDECAEIGIDIERYRRNSADYRLPLERILTTRERSRIGKMKGMFLCI